MPEDNVNIDRVGGTQVTAGAGIPVAIAPGSSVPLPAGAALDSSLTTIDTDLKASQPRVVSNNDGQMNATRYQIRSLAQDNDIFNAQPQNGFVPLAEVPSFLGGF